MWLFLATVAGVPPAVSIIIPLVFPSLNYSCSLLKVFICLNLNCKKYFISVLTTENNELDWEFLDPFDLVCYLRVFLPLYVCFSSSPTDVSNSRTNRDVNRCNTNPSVVDRLH